jgi:hypothetical protein
MDIFLERQKLLKLAQEKQNKTEIMNKTVRGN